MTRDGAEEGVAAGLQIDGERFGATTERGRGADAGTGARGHRDVVFERRTVGELDRDLARMGGERGGVVAEAAIGVSGELENLCSAAWGRSRRRGGAGGGGGVGRCGGAGFGGAAGARAAGAAAACHQHAGHQERYRCRTADAKEPAHRRTSNLSHGVNLAGAYSGGAGDPAVEDPEGGRILPSRS